MFVKNIISPVNPDQFRRTENLSMDTEDCSALASARELAWCTRITSNTVMSSCTLTWRYLVLHLIRSRL